MWTSRTNNSALGGGGLGSPLSKIEVPPALACEWTKSSPDRKRASREALQVFCTCWTWVSVTVSESGAVCWCVFVRARPSYKAAAICPPVARCRRAKVVFLDGRGYFGGILKWHPSPCGLRDLTHLQDGRRLRLCPLVNSVCFIGA